MYGQGGSRLHIILTFLICSSVFPDISPLLADIRDASLSLASFLARVIISLYDTTVQIRI